MLGCNGCSVGGIMPSATWATKFLRRGRPPLASPRSLGSGCRDSFDDRVWYIVPQSFPMAPPVDAPYLYTSNHRSSIRGPPHLASSRGRRDCLFNKYASTCQGDALGTRSRIQVRTHQAICHLVHDHLPCLKELHIFGEQELLFQLTRFMGWCIEAGGA